MRYAISGIAIVSLFLFGLGMPLLHLHPSSESSPDALLHSHMPHAEESFHGDDMAGDGSGDVKPHEVESVPFEMSALGATPAAHAPASESVAVLAKSPPVESGTKRLPSIEPEPRSQASPGILTYLSFRSPPA